MVREVELAGRHGHWEREVELDGFGLLLGAFFFCSVVGHAYWTENFSPWMKLCLACHRCSRGSRLVVMKEEGIDGGGDYWWRK